MDIREFRAKYPQYDHVSDNALSHRLWEKHYSDRVNYDTFSQKFGTSLPEGPGDLTEQFTHHMSNMLGVGRDLPVQDYGTRVDGTAKGPGYFGELPTPGGGVSTEISAGVGMDGQEVEIPLLAPGLNEAQIGHLLAGNQATPEILDNAVAHAQMRMDQGDSPFASAEELIGRQMAQRYPDVGPALDTFPGQTTLEDYTLGRQNVADSDLANLFLNFAQRATTLPSNMLGGIAGMGEKLLEFQQQSLDPEFLETFAGKAPGQTLDFIQEWSKQEQPDRGITPEDIKGKGIEETIAAGDRAESGAPVYQQRYGPEQIERAAEAGDYVGVAKSAAGFIAETGIGSLPDMAMILSAPPAWIAAMTEEIAQERAKNDRRSEPNSSDYAIGLSAAAGMSVLERIGAKAVFTKDGPIKSVGDFLNHVERGARREGLTEFPQEWTQSVAETAGTEKGFDAKESLKAGAYGALAGAGSGGAMAGAAAPFAPTDPKRAQRRLLKDWANKIEGLDATAPDVASRLDPSRAQYEYRPDTDAVVPPGLPKRQEPVEKERVGASDITPQTSPAAAFEEAERARAQQKAEQEEEAYRSPERAQRQVDRLNQYLGRRPTSRVPEDRTDRALPSETAPQGRDLERPGSLSAKAEAIRTRKKTGDRPQPTEEAPVKLMPAASPDRGAYELNTFYSQLYAAAKERLPNKGTRAQYAEQLKALVKKGYVKPEELDWNGVIDDLMEDADLDRQTARLAGQQELPGVMPKEKKISKDEVLGYIATNTPTIEEEGNVEEEVYEVDDYTREEIRVEERNYYMEHIEEYNPIDIQERFNEDEEGNEDLDNPYYVLVDQYGNQIGDEYEDQYDAEMAREEYYGEEIEEDVERAVEERIEAMEEEGREESGTQYKEDWSTKGGYDYREIKLTLPSNKGDAYKGGHWDEENVVAHLRIQTFSPGKDHGKLLLLDEIQSDWHQEGRKHGYTEPTKLTQWEKDQWSVKEGRSDRRWEVTDHLGETRTFIADTAEQAVHVMQRQWEEGYGGTGRRVPNAPFKKSWPMLAFKRGLQIAAEEGHGDIAWTVGRTQAERYNIGRAASKIEIMPAEELDNILSTFRTVTATSQEGGDPLPYTAADTVAIRVFDKPSFGRDAGPIDLNRVHQIDIKKTITAGEDRYHVIDRSHLPSLVGDKLAEEIIGKSIQYGGEYEAGTEYPSISGMDLRVGGEGMAGFYDKMLPKMVQKYVKKLGGTVDKTKLQTDEGVEEVWRVRITPEMRKKVLAEGQPMFLPKESGTTATKDQPGPEVDKETRIDVRKLNEAMSKVLGVPRDTVGIRAAEVPDSSAKALEAISEVFNVRVVPVVASDLFFDMFDGAKVPGNDGVLYVNVGERSLSNRDIMPVVWHELLHDLKDKNPDVYNWLESKLQGHLKNQDEYKERRKRSTGMDLSPEEVTEEIIADFTGDAMSDPQFLKELAGDNPRLFKKLHDVVVKWLAALKRKLRELGSTQYVDNVEKARKALRVALQEHAKVESGKVKYRKQIRSESSLKVEEGQYEVKDVSLAPSGDTGSFNFWKWFKGSKVTDEKGNPKVVYHGSRRGFQGNQFSYDVEVEKQFGEVGENDTLGFHFGTEKAAEERLFPSGEEEIEGLGRYITDSDNAEVSPMETAPYYLSIKNPLRMPDLADITYKLPLGMTANRQWEDIEDVEIVLKKVLDKRVVPAFTSFKDIRDYLKGLGYDGIVYNNAIEDVGKDSYIIFDSTQAKGVFNKGSWGKENPDVMMLPSGEGTVKFLPSRNLKRGKHTPRARPVQGQANALQVPTRGKISEKIKDNLYFNVVDRFKDLADLTKKLNLPESHDPYTAQVLFPGRAKKRLDDLNDFFLDPLVEKISEANFSMEEVGKWLHARHAQEANALLRKRNPLSTDNDALSGMTDRESQQILRQYQNNQDMQEVGRMVNALNKNRLDKAVADGIMSRAQADAWTKMYKNYIPLHRDDIMDPDGETVPAGQLPGRGKGYHIAGKESQVRAGSTKEVNHELVLAHLAAQSEGSAIRGEKNLVGQALLNMARDYPNDDFWGVNTVKKTPDLDAKGEVRYDKRIDTDHAIGVKVNGQTYYVVFSREHKRAVRLLEQLKNLEGAQIPKVLQYLQSFMQYQSLINTALNPEFVLTNLARDMQTAGYNLQDTELKGKGRKIVKNALRHGIVGMWKSEHNQHSSQWAKYADEFERAGGMVGWMDLHQDIRDRAKHIEKDIKLAGKGHHTIKSIRALGDWIMSANSSVENAVRLASYVQAREDGLSKAKAAYLAKNLTVNFNRKGANPYFNMAYLFFNAAVQGNARMLKALSTSRTVQKYAGITVLAAAALEMFNLALSGEDDDGEKWHNKIPDGVKDRNLILRYGTGEKDYATVPLPWGYNVLHVMGQTMGKGMFHASVDKMPRYSVASEGARFVNSALEAFNPLHSGSLLLLMSPTALDPFVKAGQNVDWHGGKLMPEKNPFGPEKPDSQTYFRSASVGSKWVAEKLNQFSGGSQVRPGWWDWSPETLDMVWETATGGTGRFLTNTAGTIARAVQGEFDTPKTPFARKLAGREYPYKNKEVYYERVNDLSYLEMELEATRGTPKHQTIRQAAGPRVGLIKRMKSTQKKLRDLRKRIRKREERGQDVEQLRERELQHMKDFNRAWNQRMD